MKTYPLETISIDEAIEQQYRLVDAASRYMLGSQMLSEGDLGLVPGIGGPGTTRDVEKVFADFFNVEDSVLVRGSGTGAIREGLCSMVPPGTAVLVHDAPVYPTTVNTFAMMGLTVLRADFNSIDSLETTVKEVSGQISAVLVQYTRQKMEDSYDIGEVISAVKKALPEIPVITDDNYAVLKVRKTGAELGADLSAFSMFKLMGPEGIGLVIGKKKYIEKIRKSHYSGGSQVQGHEALAALRGMVSASVLLAVQGRTIEKLCAELNSGRISGVESAFIANAQSKVVIVRLEKPVSAGVIEAAGRLGAGSWPVGAESKYEILPMIYRVSGTFIKADPESAAYMIRINPNKAGADTIIRILEKAISIQASAAEQG